MNLLKLNPLIKPKLPRRVKVFTDGAIRPERGVSGLSALVFEKTGNLLYWQSWQTGSLTCNEAEYEAVIAALTSIQPLGAVEISVFTDSQILVRQMCGTATVRAPGLKKSLVQLRGVVAGFKYVSFHHIPRERNRLADALANEAADGRTIKGWANGK